MTLFDFRLLHESEQIDLLYKHGIYIGKRKVGHLNAVLYQLEGFYVEIFYLEYRRHITKMLCFSSTALLDPYLEQIGIEHLV